MDVERKDAVEREFVASLARGLTVLRAFSKDAREMTLSEVAQRTVGPGRGPLITPAYRKM